MNCPDELTLSMFADGALSEESSPTAAHVTACAVCGTRVAGLRAEARVLAAALSVQESEIRVPAFRRPASGGALAAVAVVALVAAAAIAAAGAWLVALLPPALAWANPLDGARVMDVGLRMGLFVLEDGRAVLLSLAEVAAAAFVAGLVLWAVLSLRYRPGPLLLASLACVAVGAPETSQALEIRHAEDGTVLVSADETISDTLIAAGETVEINGDIEGDLVAVGRRVVIRGRVGGQLFTAARTVTIDGEVGGSVVGFGQTLDISSPRIGRNLFGFAATINGAETLGVGQNAVLFAEHAKLAGPVATDVYGFAEDLEVGNAVGGGLVAFANRVTLLAPARIAGDLTAHLPAADHLNISPGAVVGGQVRTEIREGLEHRNRYATGSYYLGQLLRFAAAFVTGLVLFVLFPRLRRLTLDTPVQVLLAGGVGLVTLIAAPVIAALVAVTIIGLPLGVLVLLVWLALWYLAKVLLAYFIGHRLLEAAGGRRHFAVALAVGLLLVVIAVNLPFVGGLLNFVLTICGAGVLVLFVWDAWRGTPQSGHAPI